MKAFVRYLLERYDGYCDANGVPVFPGDEVLITTGRDKGWRAVVVDRATSEAGHLKGFKVVKTRRAPIPGVEEPRSIPLCGICRKGWGDEWVYRMNMELPVATALKRMAEFEMSLPWRSKRAGRLQRKHGQAGQGYGVRA